MALDIRETLLGALGISVALVFVGFGITTFTPLPDSTPAISDPSAGTYATVECAINGTVAPELLEKIGTFGENSVMRQKLGVLRDEYDPDPLCRDADGFMRKSNLTRDLYQKALRFLLEHS